MDFVMDTVLRVPFFNDRAMSTSPNIDTTSKRFKYFVERSSKIICRFLNPRTECADYIFNKNIPIKDKEGIQNEDGEVIYWVEFITVEGIILYMSSFYI
jgi:hypothetical protein